MHFIQWVLFLFCYDNLGLFKLIAFLFLPILGSTLFVEKISVFSLCRYFFFFFFLLRENYYVAQVIAFSSLQPSYGKRKVKAIFFQLEFPPLNFAFLTGFDELGLHAMFDWFASRMNECVARHKLRVWFACCKTTSRVALNENDTFFL